MNEEADAAANDSVLRIDRRIESLREKTVRALRNAILSHHLRPGEPLVERDLCEQTGVSRSSIREALRHLESEGLVERTGAKSMTVTLLDRNKAIEIYEVRSALEAEAAKHFAERASDGDIKNLRTCWREVDRASRADSVAYSRELDRFYEILFAGAGNATAKTIMRTLRARINLMRNVTIRVAPRPRIVASIEQMKKIVDALEMRDGAAAAEASRAFVARSLEFANQFFDEQTSPTVGKPVKRKRSGAGRRS